MKWNNTIHSFNVEGLRVTRADNTLVCICEEKEDADLIVQLFNSARENNLASVNMNMNYVGPKEGTEEEEEETTGEETTQGGEEDGEGVE